MGKLSKRELISEQASMMVASLPQLIRERLLRDRAFCDEFGIDVTTTLHLGPTLRLSADNYVRAIKAALAGEKQVSVTLKSGETLNFETSIADGDLTLTGERQKLEQPYVELLSEDRKSRVDALALLLKFHVLGSARAAHWTAIVDARVLTDAEFMEILRDVNATPENFLQRMRDSTNFDARAFEPASTEYWASILPIPLAADDFDTFVRDRLVPHQKHMLALNAQLACLRIGYVAASPRLIPFDHLRTLTLQDLEPIAANDDPFSLLFLFDIAAARLDEGPEWQGLGTTALDKLLGDHESLTHRCELFAAGFVIAYARLGKLSYWKNAPLYWRRLAALTHAGIFTDAFGDKVETTPIHHWALNQFGSDYYWRTLADRREGPLWSLFGLETNALKDLILTRILVTIGGIDPAKLPEAWNVRDTYNETLEKGDFGMVGLPGPMSDFDGTFSPELSPAVFARTTEALRTAPFEIPGLQAFIHLAALTDAELVQLKDFAVRTALPADEDDAKLYLTELDAIGHAAGLYRYLPLADAIADKAMELFKHTSGRRRELVLAMLVDVASANSDEAAYMSWLSARMERLAYRSATEEEVRMVHSVIDFLIGYHPKFRTYLAAARAVIEIKSARIAAAPSIAQKK